MKTKIWCVYLFTLMFHSVQALSDNDIKKYINTNWKKVITMHFVS